ncbi:hypothetical protein HGRIS_004952 [Hohenbuehelia grisea]|uniref:Protein kinase domain-containing protein n=1 Tax=Hohenbuehelia grisea TaxID=104357 RepID=A0ABR3JDH3_9AGAR
MPYYPKGTLWDYLLKNQASGASSGEEISRSLCWALEISRAVEYLHTRRQPIVHSDIRCANVFLDDEGHARLSDYDLVSTLPADVPEHVRSERPAGHAQFRWFAPELHKTKGPFERLNPPGRYSTATDVWALAMTILEIFTAKSPYAQDITDRKGTHPQAKSDACTYKLIRRGIKSPLTLSGFLNDNETMRGLLLRCWDSTPSRRPSAMEVRRTLEMLSGIDPLDPVPEPAPAGLLTIFTPIGHSLVSALCIGTRRLFMMGCRALRWPFNQLSPSQGACLLSVLSHLAFRMAGC